MSRETASNKERLMVVAKLDERVSAMSNHRVFLIANLSSHMDGFTDPTKQVKLHYVQFMCGKRQLKTVNMLIPP